jgi:hypothetical protein
MVERFSGRWPERHGSEVAAAKLIGRNWIGMVERFSGRRPERHGGEAQQWRRSSRDEIDMMARFSSGGGAAAWRGSAAAAEKQA